MKKTKTKVQNADESPVHFVVNCPHKNDEAEKFYRGLCGFFAGIKKFFKEAALAVGILLASLAGAALLISLGHAIYMGGRMAFQDVPYWAKAQEVMDVRGEIFKIKDLEESTAWEIHRLRSQISDIQKDVYKTQASSNSVSGSITVIDSVTITNGCYDGVWLKQEPTTIIWSTNGWSHDISQ